MQNLIAKKSCRGTDRPKLATEESAKDFATSPITNSTSRIARFLIDTLPIRITPKSLFYIADVHSNRHSSADLKTRVFWPGIESCWKGIA